MIGIYKITNTINGKFYIGLSSRIEKRWIEHKTPKNLKKKTTLAKAFRKYGIENFTFEVLEYCNSENELFDREQHYISMLNPQYNMNEGGSGNKGHKLSNKMKKKLSDISKKNWDKKTDIEKNKILKNLKGPKIGHSVSEETRKKISQKLTGKKQSEETNRKRSQSQKIAMLGNKNGNKPVASFLNGIKIKEYDSAAIAASELNITPSNITSVLKKRQNTAGGFKWEYLNNK